MSPGPGSQACPKPAPRVVKAGAQQRTDNQQLAAFTRAVWIRDAGRCRCCGKRVEKCLDLKPLRGEVHHLEGRANKAVRYDPRNGVLLCAWCHAGVTAHDIAIEAFASFQIESRSYANADEELEFIR